jgi:hypothetical protein
MKDYLEAILRPKLKVDGMKFRDDERKVFVSKC